MKSKMKNHAGAVVAVSCLLVAASVATAAAAAAAGFAPKQFASVLTGHSSITAAAATAAAARPEVKVSLAGIVERDQTKIPVEKATAVNPGETLSWTITSQNDGDGAARDYKTVGQIPRGTEFIKGSAQPENEAEVTYSIDGGKSFQSQPTTDEKQVDGTTKRVPAPVSIYTQVRYEWANGLAANSKLSASYKVRVK
ncbi:MAG: hypothetical protein ACR2LC_02450 [Pyrinomonadaceae bacterium]